MSNVLVSFYICLGMLPTEDLRNMEAFGDINRNLDKVDEIDVVNPDQEPLKLTGWE